MEAKIAEVLEVQVVCHAGIGREGMEPTEQAASSVEQGVPQAEVGEGSRGEDRPRETADEDMPAPGYNHYTEEQILGTSGDGAHASKAGEV